MRNAVDGGGVITASKCSVLHDSNSSGDGSLGGVAVSGVCMAGKSVCCILLFLSSRFAVDCVVPYRMSENARAGIDLVDVSGVFCFCACGFCG